MPAQCLSACGPCAVLCDTCKAAHERYVQRTLDKQERDAIRLLKHLGYRVEAPK